MSIRLIRQESETPNVSNHDDARMVRYAYGGYDGFVKDRGQEIGHAISGTSFVVQSGVINLQGWEVEIDANGVSIPTSASVTNKQYYSVYLEVNCATDTAEIKSLTDPAGYPEIPESDDLTQNTIGTARLLLYHFTVTGGVIADIEKMVQGISYVDEIVAEINQRLDEMGFKEASSENGGIVLQNDWEDVASPKFSVAKMAKMAVMESMYVETSSAVTVSGNRITNVKNPIAILSEKFRPKKTIIANGSLSVDTSFLPYYFDVTITINTDGTITSSTPTGSASSPIYPVSEEHKAKIQCSNVGWELP